MSVLLLDQARLLALVFGLGAIAIFRVTLEVKFFLKFTHLLVQTRNSFTKGCRYVVAKAFLNVNQLVCYKVVRVIEVNPLAFFKF